MNNQHNSLLQVAGSHNTSFAILHMVAVVTNRLEKAFETSNLTSEQVYILTYINSLGSPLSHNGANPQVVLKATMVNILGTVFDCSKDRANTLFNELATDGLLHSITITNAQKELIKQKGQNTAFFVSKTGLTKIDKVVNDLRDVVRDIVDPTDSILKLPRSAKEPKIAKALRLFLGRFYSTKKAPN